MNDNSQFWENLILRKFLEKIIVSSEVENWVARDNAQPQNPVQEFFLLLKPLGSFKGGASFTESRVRIVIQVFLYFLSSKLSFGMKIWNLMQHLLVIASLFTSTAVWKNCTSERNDYYNQKRSKTNGKRNSLCTFCFNRIWYSEHAHWQAPHRLFWIRNMQYVHYLCL